ncbi:unnamed protein product [Peronospora belbahrii]|uniref:Uncharacterized protein n=1 Tax=Peronospora belbahrii TaxID=622444 RepID=A0AAU9KLN1_9STRA|nr:unnamed protein product [Peronospora belbahrii]
MSICMRALAARNLLGLEDIITLSVVHFNFQKTRPNDDNDDHKSWVLIDLTTSATMIGANSKIYPTDGCIPDTVNHVKFVRDLYEKVDPAPRTYSVPVLWGKKKSTIVSEESTGILRTFDSAFRNLVPSSVHLYPKELRAEIDAANDGIVTELPQRLRKGVCGFDQTGGAADKAEIPGGKSSDGGGCTSVSHAHSSRPKADKKHLTDCSNVVEYLRDLYQIPELKSSVNWSHLKIGMDNKHPDAIAEGSYVDFNVVHKRTQLA